MTGNLISNFISPEVFEVREKILECQKEHGYESCSQCSARLNCILIDEWNSVRKRDAERRRVFNE